MAPAVRSPGFWRGSHSYGGLACNRAANGGADERVDEVILAWGINFVGYKSLLSKYSFEIFEGGDGDIGV